MYPEDFIPNSLLGWIVFWPLLLVTILLVILAGIAWVILSVVKWFFS